MAHSVETFQNAHNGKTRYAPIGFSWTTMFFGPFPALIRGHWVAAILIAVCCFFTFGAAGVVFAFFYNNWYVSHLENDGFSGVTR